MCFWSEAVLDAMQSTVKSLEDMKREIGQQAEVIETMQREVYQLRRLPACHDILPDLVCSHPAYACYANILSLQPLKFSH